MQSSGKLAAGYNMIPNLVWSVIHLAPVTVYCFTAMDRVWVYILLGLSVLAALVPNRFFDHMQLSRTTKLYKKIGILTARRLSQVGDKINRLIRKKYPEHKIIRDYKNREAYIQRTYFYERFHFIVLVFMLAASVYAFLQFDYWWALTFIISNILYNIYPMFLQQYNRIRIEMLVKRQNT